MKSENEIEEGKKSDEFIIVGRGISLTTDQKRD